MSAPDIEQIRAVVAEHGKLAVDPSALEPQTNLYDAGMSSHASVNVMIALEDTFDVEFPDRMLTREVFETLAAMHEAIASLSEVEA